MRCVLVPWWLVVPVWFAACARPTAAAHSENALVLELGGEQGSLRQALVAAGVTPAAQASPPPEPVGPVEPAPEPEVDHDPSPSPEVAPPSAAPDHIIVELGRGETLIHLAKKHLGDGNRFREILTANGWTERDARRLPAGQMVKIPLVAPTSTPR